MLDNEAFRIVLGVAIYCAPLLIAAARGHKNFWPIFILNFFLGWTVICWFAALIWCLTWQDRKKGS